MKNNLFENYKRREIRIFISSTFRDMQNEREMLVKRIFPALRKKFKSHSVVITEVDLRWGVLEEEAQNGKVLEICLKEVDKSRPYFIGLVGERYGWVPAKSEYDKHKKIIENFEWLKEDISNELSITEMEIQYGVLRNKNMWSRSFFYFRNPENIESTKYSEPKKSDAYKKLYELKERIKNNADLKSTDYDEIEILGKKIFDDLALLIEKDFPPIPNEQKELISQLSYIQNLTKYYIQDENLLYQITKNLNEEVVVVSGGYGIGKSSLLAHLTKSFYDFKINVLFNFCSVSALSSDPIAILIRFLKELNPAFESQNSEKDNEKFDYYSGKFLEILEDTDEEYAIIIDDLDQIYENLRYDFFNLLVYLSKRPNISVLMSCENNRILKRLDSFGSQVIVPIFFENKDKTDYIETYLKNFSKKLSLSNIKSLTKLNITNIPIILNSYMNELIRYGEFETLENQIHKFAVCQNVDEFYDQLLVEIENDFLDDLELLENIYICFILTKYGITEIDLFEILAAPRIRLNQILNRLSSELDDSSNRIKIKNKYLLKAARKKYFGNEVKNENLVFKIVNQLNSKFDGISENDIDDTREIAYLISNTKNEDLIFEFVSNFEHIRFLGFYDSNLLVRCWNKLSQKYSAEQIYTPSKITQYINSGDFCKTKFQKFLTYNMFAEYLVTLECFYGAKAIYEFILNFIESSSDKEINNRNVNFIINIYLINAMIKLGYYEDAEGQLQYLINDMKVLEIDAEVWQLRLYTSYSFLYISQEKSDKALSYLNELDLLINSILEKEPAHEFDDWMINALTVKMKHFELIENYQVAEEMAEFISEKLSIKNVFWSIDYLDILIELAKFKAINGKTELAIESFAEAEVTAVEMFGEHNNRFLKKIHKLTQELGI